MENRRKTPRKEVLAPAITYIETNGKTYKSQAIIRNVSQGGVFVALYDFDEELKTMDLENMPLRLNFRFSDTQTEYAATCQARRTEKLAYTIQMGATFTDMCQEHRLALQQYCSSPDLPAT